MNVIRFYPPGGPEKLRYESSTIPVVKERELLIKVKAVGLIWPELTWPIYQDSEGNQSSHIPGHDFSGTVEAVGEGVDIDTLSPGSEVYAFTSKRNHEGAMAQYAIADIDQVVPKPRNLTFLEAGTVPLSALTAWQALFDHGNLQAGQRLLVTGAAGATGIWAVQLGRMKNARVIGTGSSKRSHEILQEFGINEFVNYAEVDLVKAVGNIDLVLDCVGGKVLEQCLRVVNKEGLVISINTFNCEAIAREHGIRGKFFIVSMNSEQLETVTALIEKGVLRPMVDTVFPLKDARKAFETAAEGHSHGRVVIEV